MVSFLIWRPPCDDIETHKEKAVWQEGWIWNYVAASLRMLNIVGNWPETRNRQGKITIHVSEEVWSCWHTDFWTSSLYNYMTTNLFWWSHPICGMLYSRLRKLKCSLKLIKLSYNSTRIYEIILIIVGNGGRILLNYF